MKEIELIIKNIEGENKIYQFDKSINDGLACIHGLLNLYAIGDEELTNLLNNCK
jgi:hypothetical protein